MNIQTTFLLRLAPLAIALTMSSCASRSHSLTATDKAQPAPAVLPAPANWYLVKKNPPTYYPKGFAANSSTSHGDGDWIYAGALGEQWFIPNGGVPGFTGQQLREDALSRKTEEQLKNTSNRAPNSYELSTNDKLDLTKRYAIASILGPLGIMGAMYSGTDPSYVLEGLSDIVR